MTKLKKVTIWTDGACSGNPGPGGFGIVLQYGDKRKELSGGFRRTTNNRMELLAAIEALRSLKEPCEVTLYSDSKYLVDAMRQGWAKKWKANGWRRGKTGPAANPDLWEKLLEVSEKHKVTFEWVKGHADDEENHTADRLATTALLGPDLAEDEGYKG